MPDAMQVPSSKWELEQVLFEDSNYSFIVGTYKDLSRKCIGERWRGPVADRLLGFPFNERAQAEWYPVPEFLEIPILHALLDEIMRHPGRQTANCSPEKILTELKSRHALARTV